MRSPFVIGLVVSASVLGFLCGRLSVGSVDARAPSAVARPRAPASIPAPSIPASAIGAISGRVAELIQVPGYTYLRLDTSAGERWAAVSTNTTVKNGDAVTLIDAMEMHGFASPTLKRSFDTIYFAQLATH